LLRLCTLSRLQPFFRFALAACGLNALLLLTFALRFNPGAL
jgi:hypothetical protein